ncbi:MAG: hypothetical protein ACKO45_00415 [Cyanobium sp.]
MHQSVCFQGVSRNISDLSCASGVAPAYDALLGWLLIPHQQAVEVWPASGAAQRLDTPDVLEGGPEFPCLQLQLAEIWAG